MRWTLWMCDLSSPWFASMVPWYRRNERRDSREISDSAHRRDYPSVPSHREIACNRHSSRSLRSPVSGHSTSLLPPCFRFCMSSPVWLHEAIRSKTCLYAPPRDVALSDPPLHQRLYPHFAWHPSGLPIHNRSSVSSALALGRRLVPIHSGIFCIGSIRCYRCSLLKACRRSLLWLTLRAWVFCEAILTLSVSKEARRSQDVTHTLSPLLRFLSVWWDGYVSK